MVETVAHGRPDYCRRRVDADMFLLGILAGVPIAFTLGLSAMVCFICNPSLPFVFFSQQVLACADHFVLLAIPLFLLAVMAMEHNGMSTRIVELVVGGMERFRDGLNMATVLSMAFSQGFLARNWPTLPLSAAC